ncbi:MAG: adenylate cyclase [Solirubrobacteraceae bacterium]|jgi:adenylate cyclase|nr:adenylate cyclase [Solirubrobacteraceae bacterium]
MAGADHTFLFADLVGFTALAESDGDDRALEVALELQRRVGGILGAHGAEQVKAIGDCVMLRCPDPAAAVELGLEVVDTLAADPDFPLVRVGVHTGPAIARDGDWYGRTVNVAARLCSVAAGGDVVVSETTRDAAGDRGRVEYGERQLHWLRNVTQPVATYAARPRERHSPVRLRHRCPLARKLARLEPAT